MRIRLQGYVITRIFPAKSAVELHFAPNANSRFSTLHVAKGNRPSLRDAWPACDLVGHRDFGPNPADAEPPAGCDSDAVKESSNRGSQPHRQMNTQETTSLTADLISSVTDFEFGCPNCTQLLMCSTDHVGATVTCPICGSDFTVPAPAGSTAPLAGRAELPISDEVKQWTVDVRVLVLRAPPVYVKILIEVPKSWVPPTDANLPEPALEAVKKAVRARYPQSPVTPVKIRTADAQALKRISEHSDYRNECCRAWLLGTPNL